MKNLARSLAVAGILVVPAGLVTAQNDMPIDNEGDVVFLYSSPTGGSPTGTIPPDIATGDFYYQVYQGDRVMRHTDDATGAATIGISGYLEAIFDTYWGTDASFYDRCVGPAVPDTVCPEGRMPAFLLPTGFTTEVFVSLGPSGFGGPCSLFPSFCSSTSSTCAPPGFVNGWGVGITLTSSIVVASDGTGASDVANTYFLPSGMSWTTPGFCGMGDYAIQDAHSTDETQADYLGGVGSGCGAGLSEFGGFASGGSGPLQEPVTSILEGTWSFDQAVTNALADSGLGGGFERSWGDVGGATNALNVPLSLGGAVLVAGEHRNLAAAGSPGPLTVGALSWTGEGGGVLPSPGLPVFGTWLLISPAGVAYTTSLGTWLAAGVTCDTVTPIFLEGIGDLSVAGIAIPGTTVGTNLGLQTGVMLSGSVYDAGNAVEIKLR